MGVVDLLILAFILFFAIRGVIRGFVIEVVGLLGLLLAFLFSFMLFTPISTIVSAIGITGDTGAVVAYVIGFIVIYVMVVVLGRLLHKALSVIYLGWLNRTIGFLFGAFKGSVIAGIILWALVYVLPYNAQLATDIKNSKVAQTTMKIVPYVYAKINSFSGVDRINPFNK